MALILSIESATTNCSVAIADNGKLLHLVEDASQGYSHGEQLHTFIDQVLLGAGKTLDQLDAVAVSKGPGSYTGLRIGVSAAKGLCYSLDLPLIALPTLDIMVQAADQKADIIIPMLDARRMEVYAGIYDSDKKQVRATQAEILDSDSYKEVLASSSVLFYGNGAEKWASLCSHPNASFAVNTLPSAKDMSLLAQQAYDQEVFEDVAYFEPFYLKDFKSF
ncbi:MAG: tRNA (adenosine(37)-N6)-threonylcarbamoyltransferase complex dimerization subunit type 1 TsaB [Bacteroidetes bacterium]|nr:tRNA (adenosine(37)-N6)-threonylcarbamoyltransferase complex dimerization subunit type 1 TsaB [Bacteroidota bacterium]